MDTAVTDASAAPSPATAEPSFEQVQQAWTPAQLNEWQKTGKEPETTAAPSPAPGAPAQADDAGTDAAPGTAESQEKPKKTQSENFAELRRQRDEAKGRAELLERQLAESRKPAPAADREEQPKPATSAGKPKLSEYTAKIGDTYQTFEEAQEAYDDARDEYRERTLDAKQSHKQTAESWNGQVTTAKAKYADFEAVAFNADTPASDVMVKALQSRKDGAEIAYYLGQNPEVAKALTGRTEADPADLRALGRAEALAEVEFDRIAESFKESLEPKTVTSTRATGPGQRVRASSTPVDPIDAAYAKGDYDTAMKLENERDRERRKKGWA